MSNISPQCLQVCIKAYRSSNICNCWLQTFCFHSDRSKSKAYEKQLHALDQVAIELSCHSDDKVSSMTADVEAKVRAMTDVMKAFKKLVFKTEAELKKDYSTT